MRKKANSGSNLKSPRAALFRPRTAFSVEKALRDFLGRKRLKNLPRDVGTPLKDREE